MATYKEKIKTLRASVSKLKEENAQLRAAIEHQNLYKDIEQAANAKEFDVHCIKLKYTKKRFEMLAVPFKSILRKSVVCYDVEETEKTELLEIVSEWMSDAINCRDIVDQLKDGGSIVKRHE